MVINHQVQFCPVHLMLKYLSVRGGKPRPLFILADGSAVIRTHFTEQLSIAFKYCSLDPSRYKGQFSDRGFFLCYRGWNVRFQDQGFGPLLVQCISEICSDSFFIILISFLIFLSTQVACGGSYLNDNCGLII